jgi:iron-sulfur cluster assembly protein
MFTLTPAAATRILDSASQSDAVGMALRVAAKMEEDGQISFGLGFDDEREHDLSYECEGLTVLIAPPSRELLEGMLLDFVESRGGRLAVRLHADRGAGRLPALQLRRLRQPRRLRLGH